jgi:hypothetical protein
MLSYKYRNILLASLLFGSSSVQAFAPSNNRVALITQSSSSPIPSMKKYSTRSISNHALHLPTFDNTIRRHHVPSRYPSTSLKMAAEDFNESKYTESAWACIASLTKVADYYSSSTIDSPMLMDVLLNPSKHNAGDDAESAKRAVEKALLKSDIDVKVVRQELETYMSKQPKLTGSSSDQQKVMGRNMVRVLEAARDTKQLLGVRSKLCAVCLFVCLFVRACVRVRM